jgi:hypothetical protein
VASVAFLMRCCWASSGMMSHNTHVHFVVGNKLSCFHAYYQPGFFLLYLLHPTVPFGPKSEYQSTQSGFLCLAFFFLFFCFFHASTPDTHEQGRVKTLARCLICSIGFCFNIGGEGQNRGINEFMSMKDYLKRRGSFMSSDHCC